MPCDIEHHDHLRYWSTEPGTELIVWPCERYCGYCKGNRAKFRFNQCSHLRTHVKETHIKKENMEVKLQGGVFGNSRG